MSEEPTFAELLTFLEVFPEETPTLPDRHAGHARLLTEAEIREIEAERGRL